MVIKKRLKDWDIVVSQVEIASEIYHINNRLDRVKEDLGFMNEEIRQIKETTAFLLDHMKPKQAGKEQITKFGKKIKKSPQVSP